MNRISKIEIIFLLFLSLVSLKTWGQEKKTTVRYDELSEEKHAKIDSLILSKIPYDSHTAISDIERGTVRIINLICSGDPFNTNEEHEKVENLFKFKFFYDCIEFKLPQEYILIKQNEYNQVIYKYLDSINNTDSKSTIYDELIRLFVERSFVPKYTDKNRWKKIRKNLKGESKNIKQIFYKADLLYRDRNYNDAYAIYNNIAGYNEKSKFYLLTSKYHCLINLGKYSDAKLLYSNNKEFINRKSKYRFSK